MIDDTDRIEFAPYGPDRFPEHTPFARRGYLFTIPGSFPADTPAHTNVTNWEMAVYRAHGEWEVREVNGLRRVWGTGARFYKRDRAPVFDLVGTLEFEAVSEDRRVLDALAHARAHQDATPGVRLGAVRGAAAGPRLRLAELAAGRPRPAQARDAGPAAL